MKREVSNHSMWTVWAGGEGSYLPLTQAWETPIQRNKAGYTATLVACGWAGAEFELLKHLGKCNEAKDRKNIKKVKWGPTNQPTDRPTD